VAHFKSEFTLHVGCAYKVVEEKARMRTPMQNRLLVPRTAAHDLSARPHALQT
jgi:hypothetical protein